MGLFRPYTFVIFGHRVWIANRLFTEGHTERSASLQGATLWSGDGGGVNLTQAAKMRRFKHLYTIGEYTSGFLMTR